MITILISLGISLLIARCSTGRFRRGKPSDGTLYIPWRFEPCVRVLPPLLALSSLSSGFFLYPLPLEQALANYFAAFATVFFYYALVLALLPLLRRHITATACSILWLLPAVYFILTPSVLISKPLLVIPISGSLLRVFALIWAVGLVAILLWHTVDHLLFRSHVLRHAVPVTDPAVLEVWNREVLYVGENPQNYEGRLVISPAVTTPLSIGLIRGSTQVVLPQRPYTTDELTLIFRHELVHLVRGDNWTKLSLLLYKALCWFNPLMWLAMGRSGADMEQSCDELVLTQEPEAVRRQYAELILQTVGTDRGFTTCLSASATALRNRLKHAVHPRQLRSGAVVLTLACMMLFLSGGMVALRYDRSTVRETILTDDLQLSIVSIYGLDGSEYHCSDPEALLNYLADLPIDTLSNPSFPTDHMLTVVLEKSDSGSLSSIHLRDHTLISDHFRYIDQAYYLPQGVDWDFLFSLLHEIPTTA